MRYLRTFENMNKPEPLDYLYKFLKDKGMKIEFIKNGIELIKHEYFEIIYTWNQVNDWYFKITYATDFLDRNGERKWDAKDWKKWTPSLNVERGRRTLYLEEIYQFLERKIEKVDFALSTKKFNL